MQRSASKNQKLKERLEAIQRELSRVDGNIRTVSQAVEHPDSERAQRQLKQLAVEQDRPRELATGTPRVAGSERLVTRDAPVEKPAFTVGEGQEVPGGEPGGFGYDPVIPKAPADQRFANYFVTGGLHSVRPLRQEQRVQRNKAILMTIIAAVVLYGVLSLLF